MKHHPEQIKKNKAFLMLANYWDKYSEKKKDLEKPMTVTEYLNENSYVPATVAIELNEEILELDQR